MCSVVAPRCGVVIARTGVLVVKRGIPYKDLPIPGLLDAASSRNPSTLSPCSPVFVFSLCRARGCLSTF